MKREEKLEEKEIEVDYERIRLENIKRNTDFLESIGIDPIRDSLKVLPKKTSRKESFPKAVPRATPPRRSSRITMLTLQNQLEEAKESGDSSLIETTAAKMKSLDIPIDEKIFQEEEAIVTLTGAPISMKTHLFQSDEDEIGGSRLIEYLKAIPLNEELISPNCRQSSLILTEDHVAKVTKSRITVASIHPSVSKTLVMAGDKEGYIGIWTPDIVQDGVSGVHLYKPHSSNVCSIFVPPSNPHQLWSVSYDCTIRYTDIDQESFVQLYQVEGDGYVTDAFFGNSVSNLYVSMSSGEIQVVDTRTKSCQLSGQIYDGKINSIQTHPSLDQIILTAGRSGYVGLHDIRMQSKNWKPLQLLTGNSHSVNSASFSPDGKYIVSVGQDNTIQAWENYLDGLDSILHTKIRHNNQTGRWLSTLRPVFDPKEAHTFLVGSMEQPRRLELFTIQKSGCSEGEQNPTKKRKTESINLSLISTLQSDFLGSVCSRNAFHPTRNMIVGGNSSGRVHLFS